MVGIAVLCYYVPGSEALPSSHPVDLIVPLLLHNLVGAQTSIENKQSTINTTHFRAHLIVTNEQTNDHYSKQARMCLLRRAV